MADETPTTITPPAAVPQANPPATPPAADVIAALEAKVTDLGKKLGEVSQEAADRRVAAKAADAAKATAEAAALEAKRAAGELGPVLEAKEKALKDAQAELARLSPMATRYEASAAKKRTTVEAAIAEAGLPVTIKRGLEIALRAGEIDEAADLLADHRASVAPGAPKQPAPAAPNTGGAPASPSPVPDINKMSAQEIINLKSTDPAAHAKAFGGASSNSSSRSILGKWLNGG